jgi:predicted heme/steroid binding protein
VATAEAEVGKVIDQVQETGQAAAEELKETVEEARETVAEAADDLAQKADETAETVKAAIQGEEEKPVLLTLEELKEFTGKDGKPAYVAVDGVVYDVTASALWKDGSHNGFEAGQDLTEAIKEKAPHGVEKLENVKEIGRVKVELTLEELKEFNGKDGKPAYVAVDGVIYDVTASALWKDGSHNGFEAGQDLTEAIKEKSPHGVGKLENVVEIGVLKD